VRGNDEHDASALKAQPPCGVGCMATETGKEAACELRAAGGDRFA
jgi:hypothetical protein